MQEVGVQLEEADEMPDRREFRCAECGYGAVVHRALPPCPMCGGTVWESRGPLEPGRID